MFVGTILIVLCLPVSSLFLLPSSSLQADIANEIIEVVAPTLLWLVSIVVWYVYCFRMFAVIICLQVVFVSERKSQSWLNDWCWLTSYCHKLRWTRSTFPFFAETPVWLRGMVCPIHVFLWLLLWIEEYGQKRILLSHHHQCVKRNDWKRIGEAPNRVKRTSRCFVPCNKKERYTNTTPTKYSGLQGRLKGLVIKAKIECADRRGSSWTYMRSPFSWFASL